MSTLSIHMWSNPIAKWSHPLKGTCLDHIWSKSTVWQTPPMRGTFWATFGQSPLRDKVLQQGANFGPHLVEVHCMTKSSNEGHILGHIWSKPAGWQSPPMRGTFWVTFGQSPLGDKVLQRGAHFVLHLVKVCCVTKSSIEGPFLGHIWLKSAAWQSRPIRGTFWATFGWSPLHDKVIWQGAHFGPL
jgi:hypothetical protein